MSVSRRQFLNNTATLMAGTAILSPLLLHGKASSPNEKIRVALIGCRGMGWGDLQNAVKQPGVECAALCDVDEAVLNKRTAEMAKQQGTAPAQYKDFRRLLEDKSIDAVIIGTPDHWHCLPFVYACQAGKDVYVEKPLGNTIAECDAMVKAARSNNRVVQVGQQQRSGPHWINAMNIIKSGKLGQLRKVNIWANFNYGVGAAIVPDSKVPEGVDFDFWLGPAPARSFNAARFHSTWRMFWDYGGGLMTDWGVHLLDVALWAKDITTMPAAIMATGGNFTAPDRAHETFDTMNVVFQHKDYLINWDHTAGTQNGPYGRSYGLAFIGNDATMVIDRNAWELFPEWDDQAKKPKTSPLEKQSGGESHELHMKNFLECIKSRKDPACTIENGSLVAKHAHAGNIALRTQSRLEWNAGSNNFGKNSAANGLIMPKYRKPWVFPG
ncbi:gfo/Idh/MocA family oxidoreductase [Chitinophaga silvatica]|uniref:Gfo/Idh/MocA family oxidoreductase n=1 Tax=Chitinophaga silvatica TaxID=2282649 RepID=A0A3E1Y954_9BACT|nr:Gfo/Idh/MocA family oxidoreductase [Chitinophaga silvatica]RFS21937.1 gfo/Idh/MocA family oxidoreductase [Chitinophaga silvatica]